MKKCLFVFFAILVFSACENSQDTESLQQTKLFALNYGSFEDELDLFDLKNTSIINTYIQMRDGFFFITNGKAKKVIQLTSYGDLLSVFYNPDYNPVPSFVEVQSTDNQILTSQQAIEYPFNTLGHITVDTQKGIYVVDRVPTERRERDESQRLLLQDVVLRFANDGTFIDYIGQQGPGGTPFPHIAGVYTTNSDELVVVSVTGTGMLVNWFNSDGFLRYTLPIQSASLPIPFETDQEVYISVDTIVPDYNVHKVYIKVDYYLSSIDPSTNVQLDVSYYSTELYPLNIETGSFDEPISVPAHEEETREGLVSQTFKNAYQFLGVSQAGWFYFLSPVETGYSVQIISNTGERVLKKHLDIPIDNLYYNNFSLSNDGIITALLCNEFEANVVWWRTDNLLLDF